MYLSSSRAFGSVNALVISALLESALLRSALLESALLESALLESALLESALLESALLESALLLIAASCVVPRVSVPSSLPSAAMQPSAETELTSITHRGRMELFIIAFDAICASAILSTNSCILPPPRVSFMGVNATSSHQVRARGFELLCFASSGSPCGACSLF
jgi:hypothetical protein